MDEFTFMEDWDLQAVVRSGVCNNTNDPSSIFSDVSSILDRDDDLLINFPDFFESKGVNDHHHGQDKAYKHVNTLLHHQHLTLSPQSILSTNSSLSVDVQDPEILQKKHLVSEPDVVAHTGSKSKRSRRNQQRRVVKHVKEDDLSSDMWAWRKYGQKPIKGSPYPRSYYRCSSLKGCLARKQVERSSCDPSIFIITYTAEHTHAHPTRRNSLAGSTRTKPTQGTKNDEPNQPDNPKIKDERSDSVLIASSDYQSVKIKNEEEDDDDEIVVPDIFRDDLFPSLEDFEGMFVDHQFSATVP